MKNDNNYNLSNPMERSRIIMESMKRFSNEQIIVSVPGNEPHIFKNCLDAFMFVFWHVDTVDCQGQYIRANLGNINSSNFYVSIETDQGNYLVRMLKSYYYDYEQDKTFARDEATKVKMMEREFNSRFSETELDTAMVNQSLNIIDTNNFKTAIEDKIEEMLNRYFTGRWYSYSVETRKLDNISTQYTLKIKYDAGIIQLNKPQ